MKKRKIIAGIDEAGRGPWAGPVIAACVVLPKYFPKKILGDSKKISPQKREEVYTIIKERCSFGIGVVDNNGIDTIGIKDATEMAMIEALEQLKFKPGIVLVDGRDKFQFPIQHKSIIKGDETISEISAASIVAKVWRDKLMQLYHEAYPQYGFNNHRGYGTKRHQEALKKHGVCPIHRASFQPIKRIISIKKRKK